MKNANLTSRNIFKKLYKNCVLNRRGVIII